MRDPVRLRDDPGVSDDTRDLLRSFPGPRGGYGSPRLRPMSSAERARATRRIAVIAALPVTAGTLFGAKGVAVAALLLAGSAVGVRVGADAIWSSSSPNARGPTGGESAMGAPGAGAAPATLPRAESTSQVSPVTAPTEPAPVETPAPSAGPQAAGVAAAREGAPSAPEQSAAEISDTLLAEVALLERARSLAASDPSGALGTIEEHAVLFPNGKLSVERELIAVDALGRAGRSGEARARAEALLARTEGGLYEQRVRALVETLD